MTTFDNIKKYSKIRGLSLRETSKKAGLSENALYRYNQGIEPKFETLNSVSKVLNVPISKLSNKYKNKNDNTEVDNSVDLDDLSTIMTFQGEPIPEKYKEIVRDLLRSLKDKEKNEK